MEHLQGNIEDSSSSELDDDNSASASGAVQKCSKCRESKPPSDFYHRNGKPDRICKSCKKAAQKDHYRKKTFTENVDVVFGSILNKILDYKILRVQLVNDELKELIRECETQLQGKKLMAT